MVIRLRIIEKGQFSSIHRPHRRIYSQLKFKPITLCSSEIIGEDHPRYAEIQALFSGKPPQVLTFFEEKIKRGQEVDLSPYQKPERQEIHQRVRKEIDQFIGELPSDISQEEVIRIINSSYPDLRVIVAKPQQIQILTNSPEPNAAFREPISLKEEEHMRNLFESYQDKGSILEQTAKSKKVRMELGMSDNECCEVPMLFIPYSAKWSMIDGTHELAHYLYYLRGVQTNPEMSQFQSLEDFINHKRDKGLVQTGQGLNLNEQQRKNLFFEALAEAEVNQTLLSSKNLLAKVGSLGLINQASYGANWLKILPSSNIWETLGLRELNEK